MFGGEEETPPLGTRDKRQEVRDRALEKMETVHRGHTTSPVASGVNDLVLVLGFTWSYGM